MLDGRPIRLRFAPSPNGYLHLGHAYSALVNARIAMQLCGQFILRMENIDVTRCKTEFERAIIEDLSWLGLTFDKPIRRQIEHFADYQQALDELKKLGLVYPAFMSRGEVREKIKMANLGGKKWLLDPDGTPLYPTDERSLPVEKVRQLIGEGKPYSWRLNMDLALQRHGDNLYWQEFNGDSTYKVMAHPELWGDVVVARKEIPTSYHLAVVVDDHWQGISHIVRGKDLYQATSVHCLLQKIFGFNTPLYYHHPLILGEDGHKLSKTDNDTSLRSLRRQGLTFDKVVASLPKF
ncbi:tRNA glutamyl-Q(34) synthetase GluQRS [uncultured Bartonella sp.]|uniref:tRNA glutamyl-Q(34) synthetase GluQRS n=1 Tax=uncultured Bartonella sp. TaxID=104108 RepID=UPI002626C1C2|nr:tRNA glutamyl-Q(34) synthetase GluQRS [uncultured Bartonella sp.]